MSFVKLAGLAGQGHPSCSPVDRALVLGAGFRRARVCPQVVPGLCLLPRYLQGIACSLLLLSRLPLHSGPRTWFTFPTALGKYTALRMDVCAFCQQQCREQGTTASFAALPFPSSLLCPPVLPFAYLAFTPLPLCSSIPLSLLFLFLRQPRWTKCGLWSMPRWCSEPLHHSSPLQAGGTLCSG